MFDLRIHPVTKTIGDNAYRMFAYNGSVPGPLLRVRQGSEIFVNVLNELDIESTVHWHGLRLENAFDGVPHETQAPIPPGGRYIHRLQFPDAGVYWYHPHMREDFEQEMGLYGNIVVVPSDPDYWPPVDHEAFYMLDDILIEDGHIAPFSEDHSNYTAMGRFGNVVLVNGETNQTLHVRAGEVVRFSLTNSANTRVFKVAVPGNRMKLVGSDGGRYEHEAWAHDIVIAPSERFIVDVLFDTPGEFMLEHQTPGKVYPLVSINVADDRVETEAAARFADMRANADMVAERRRIARYVDAPPDKILALVAEMDFDEPAGATTYTCPMHPEVVRDEPGSCPKCGMKLMPVAPEPTAPPVDAGSSGGGHAHGHDHGDAMADGIEWEDMMVDVNRQTTPENMRWKLVDRATGAENHEIDWTFNVGDQVKIRLVNEMDSDHPMHHPFHIHGERFLVLARDGLEEPNLVWKDTVLVRTGQTVDILMDASNPGWWMAHCHIAEHSESGMMFNFRVAGRV